MNDTQPLPDDSQLSAPTRLAADLAGVLRRPVEVPPDVDAAVAAMTRRHFAATRRRRLVIGLCSGAAAAALLVVAAVWMISSRETNPLDVNRDGRVDILDAYALESAIEGRRPLRREWDVNGDGVVDRADVDCIAVTVVSLTPRPVR